MNSRLLDEEFIRKIERLELISRKIVAGKVKGERRSRRRGHSSEFADYRPYVSGDDLRFLDWNIYGRLDRLFLKLFLEEEELWVNLIIDRSPSMRYGDPDKLEYAKRVAAALAYIGLYHHDRVRVGAFSSRLTPLLPPARGRRHIQRMLDALEKVEPEEGETDLARACRDFVVQKRPSGIVVLISDFFDRRGFEAALRYLLSGAGRSEIYVLQVLSPQEIEPTLTGDLKLVDCEDGLEAEVSVSGALLKAYRRNLDAFRGELKEFAGRRGLHYAFASTEVPFDRLILEFFRKRGLLR